tara:strand:- start:298 stop:558 length:261 start_codon:yes stop_codon:yes gene_type:complete
MSYNRSKRGHNIIPRSGIKNKRYTWNNKVKKNKIVNPYRDMSFRAQQKVLNWAEGMGLLEEKHDFMDIIDEYCNSVSSPQKEIACQ